MNLARKRKMLKVLRQARSYVEEGWTRGRLQREGRVCAAGALNKALSGDPRRTGIREDAIMGRDLRHFMEGIIRSKYGQNAQLTVFNDRQKSKHAVLALFDTAIEYVARTKVERT